MKITYYGHSSFGININGKNLLFDPFITPNSLAKSIDINSIPVDYMLITHGHMDHVADAVAIAKRTNAKIICTPEVGHWFEKQGVTNILAMNTGGKTKLDFGNVKCVRAEHSSSMPDGSYGGNPLGFVVESNEGNFYYAGDTALTYDMKLIGDYRHINFAFLPIGDNYTMGVDNAIIATEFINCKDIIGMHYDTFEVIKINHDEAVKKFAHAGKKLTLMPIGETINR
ncbi:MAG TPA: metal-dependent hydrolase [Bacteroidia bacterium]|nr:metal-dependent hydrolase [Bacteroidia bacterium]